MGSSLVLFGFYCGRGLLASEVTSGRPGVDLVVAQSERAVSQSSLSSGPADIPPPSGSVSAIRTSISPVSSTGPEVFLGPLGPVSSTPPWTLVGNEQ